MYELFVVLAMTKEQLNDSPVVKYLTIIVMLIAGPLFFINGLKGVRDREITVSGKFSTKTYSGKMAVFAGIIQIVCGAAFFAFGLFSVIPR